MKKYITTKKWASVKEGTIFKPSFTLSNFYVQDGGVLYIHEHDMKHLLNVEYLKELQEPKFTKDDMLSFGKMCALMPNEAVSNLFDTYNENNYEQ